jgi:NO-binding membrane sensor protein with MHYT domain
MNRLLLIASAVVSLAVLAPSATAHADTDEFIDYLIRHGEDSPTAEIQMAQVNLGMAICNLYATSMSDRHVVNTMRAQGDTTDEIAMWTYGSVTYLCPQYEDLLGL